MMLNNDIFVFEYFTRKIAIVQELDYCIPVTHEVGGKIFKSILLYR